MSREVDLRAQRVVLLAESITLWAVWQRRMRDTDAPVPDRDPVMRGIVREVGVRLDAIKAVEAALEA